MFCFGDRLNQQRRDWPVMGGGISLGAFSTRCNCRNWSVMRGGISLVAFSSRCNSRNTDFFSPTGLESHDSYPIKFKVPTLKSILV